MTSTSQIRLAELSNGVSSINESSAPSTSRGDHEAAVVVDEERPRSGKPVEAFESYPDGGYAAWLQVACGFAIIATTNGGVYSWGILQDALFERGVAPSSTLSYIGSTQATLQALFAIPINRLVAAYGPRKVAIVGSLLAGAGPILASFCSHSVAGLIITEGFVFGLGQALCFFCAALLPSNYFLHRRNLATGIVYAGAGVGGAVFALITSALIKRFDVPWSFRILGLIFLSINLPCAWVLKSRSPKVPLRRKEGEEKAKLVDGSFLRDTRFVLLLIGGAIALFPLFVPPFFLPLFGTSIGLSGSQSSLLLAGFNLSSAFGRVTFGLGADALFGSLNSMVLCLFSVAVSTLAIWPLAGSIGPLAAFSVINGFCAGGFFSLMPGVLATLFGSKNLRVVFGMVLTSWIPGYFLGAPIAGYLLQALGGPNNGYEAFRPAIFYSGGLSMVSALLLLAVRLKQTRAWVKI